jgi:hypothetical protein
MRTDGVADRLKGAIGLGAIVASIVCGGTGALVCSSANAASSAALAALPPALGRYYDAENRAVADAYAERARAKGLVPSRSETCFLPTGATSARPTVLAVPPLSAAAIRQREAAVAEIDAYLDPATSAAALRARTIGLQTAANAHGQGDLFVEDVAARLAQAIPGATDSARARALADARPIVRKLIDILTQDVTRQRTDTVDATALADRVRLAPGAAGPPSCSEPAIFERSAATPAANASGASDARAIELSAKARAAVAANPIAVLDAMRIAIDARDAREAVRARSELERAARNFIRQTAEGRL